MLCGEEGGWSDDTREGCELRSGRVKKEAVRTLVGGACRGRPPRVSCRRGWTFVRACAGLTATCWEFGSRRRREQRAESARTLPSCCRDEAHLSIHFCARKNEESDSSGRACVPTGVQRCNLVEVAAGSNCFFLRVPSDVTLCPARARGGRRPTPKSAHEPHLPSTNVLLSYSLQEIVPTPSFSGSAASFVSNSHRKRPTSAFSSNQHVNPALFQCVLPLADLVLSLRS